MKQLHYYNKYIKNKIKTFLHINYIKFSPGFQFSADERSALLQFDGGPCSVIASVQAFVIKNLLFNHPLLNKDTLSGQL